METLINGLDAPSHLHQTIATTFLSPLPRRPALRKNSNTNTTTDTTISSTRSGSRRSVRFADEESVGFATDDTTSFASPPTSPELLNGEDIDIKKLSYDERVSPYQRTSPNSVVVADDLLAFGPSPHQRFQRTRSQISYLNKLVIGDYSTNITDLDDDDDEPTREVLDKIRAKLERAFGNGLTLYDVGVYDLSTRYRVEEEW